MKNQKHEKNNKRSVAFVDIDETICFYDNEDRVYEEAKPSSENIHKINKLYDEGWEVVYWTARGSSAPTLLDRMAYLRELTENQLNTWGAKFHRLEMGDKKPLFDMVIDDRAKRIEEL